MSYRFIFLALSLGFIPSADATLYMEDGITNAAVGGNPGSATPWGGSSSQVKIASGNLTNSTLLPVAVPGNLVNIVGTGGGSSFRPFNTSLIASGAVYYSFLVQCPTIPTASTVF